MVNKFSWKTVSFVASITGAIVSIIAGIASSKANEETMREQIINEIRKTK